MDISKPDQSNLLRIVFWETTVRCNLSCGHCRRLAQEPRGELTTREGKEFIDQLADLSQHQNEAVVLIFSGGEPLLRGDLFDLAEYAHEKKIHIALASNGTLIDSSIAERIAAAGFGRVAVSLDGPTADLHDRLRQQPGCFNAALHGIQHCRDSGIGIQINTTVSRSNVRHLEEMLNLVIKIGAAAWHVFIFVPVGCGSELPTDEMLSGREAQDVLEWLYQVSCQNQIQIKPTCAPQYYRILARHEALGPGGVWHRYTRGCLAGINVCFVGATGKVFPCGYLPAEAGDIRKEPFEQIWQKSEVFNQLRDYGLLKGKCGGCKFVGVCGGCRARAFSLSGDFLAEDPGCSAG
jgi:radical SAM protein with 4Fe4S-binding SPASM domain